MTSGDEKLEGRGPLGKPRHGLMDNIHMDIKEIRVCEE
jgi:hypothetical protein